MKGITTLGALKQSAYQPKSIKDELRDNLIVHLQNQTPVFKNIMGFNDTVIPNIERAVLSKHNILLLGLRGQAKTRLARLMVELLDEYIPIVSGSELFDDPLQAISKYAIDLIAEKGDDTPIEWVHRHDRYVEKLATPDVNIADLIGDVDPIKAATLKLPYSDERVIHFGLIPRAHRCIFVINELPDLQPRIQVSLFNILQEGDIQIRGFKIRLPLDVQFVFTANPEDYTNRGSIITPLKDRIESQILTHYPPTLEIARAITEQEASLAKAQEQCTYIPDVCKDIVNQIAFEARKSDYIDDKSGVSARVSIAAYENLISTAERRMLINNEKSTEVRIIDFIGVIPALVGKIELVYEGEQEGITNVAIHLIRSAIKTVFLQYFPDPDKLKRGKDRDSYGTIRAWFSGGNVIDLYHDAPEKFHQQQLDKVAGLRKLVEQIDISKKDTYFFMELVLHAMVSFEVLNKDLLNSKMVFSDLLANMFDDDMFDDDSLDDFSTNN